MKALMAMLALALLLPGCVQQNPDPAANPAVSQSLLERAAATVPSMQTDVAKGVDWWASFSTNYVKRDLYSPNNGAARDHIAATLRLQGYDVELLKFPAGAFGQEAPVATGPIMVNVVAATRPGTGMADHAIAIGAHYDTQSATLEGAYDNGSGTAAVISLCDALSNVPTRRTVICLLFDGEEAGAVGSAAYAATLPQKGVTLDAYIGFDMIGINYPGKEVEDGTWKLYAWVGNEFEDSLFPFVNGTLHETLGHPLSGVEAFPFNDRNSDEASFKEAGIPTIRYAGGRTARDYPEYHKPGDTVQFVYDFVEGRKNFELGFGAAVEAAYTQTMMFDATSLEEMRAEYA